MREHRSVRGEPGAPAATGLTVLRPGPLASVQDLGRPGLRQSGICPGGALDASGLSLANLLVGNPPGAAGLELTLGGCEFRFERAGRLALVGDDFGAMLDGQPAWPGWSLPVEAGQVLRLGPANRWSGGKAGIRSWLAISGGIDVAPVLGSRSTDLKAGFGGFHGRALRKGDVLPLGACRLDDAVRTRRAFGVRMPAWQPAGRLGHAGEEGKEGRPDEALDLRVIPGPELHLFTPASQACFWNEAWRITPRSSRMGSRTEGPPLVRRQAGDMLSSAVVPGTIQVPPSGEPIVLMGDSQTTGGYPRAGVVIRADLWRLARAPIHARLRFVAVDAQAALAAWAELQGHLAQVAHSLVAAGWPGPPHNGGEGEARDAH